MHKRIIVSDHAGKRMYERAIGYADVLHILSTGEIIEQYPDDLPYPSRLILGFWESRALHIIVADDDDNRATIIVTVYEPDAARWQSDFRRRK